MLTMNGYKARRTSSRTSGRIDRSPLAQPEPETPEQRAEREVIEQQRRERDRSILAAKGICCGTAPDSPRPAQGPHAAAQAIVACPGCGKTLYAPAAWAGQVARCGCGTRLVVPDSVQAVKPVVVPVVVVKATVPPLPPVKAYLPGQGKPAVVPPLPVRVICCPSCKAKGTVTAGLTRVVCPRCRWRFEV